jgi:hypothetical protein
MDYELGGQFLLAGAVFQNTQIPFAMFRQYSDQKTAAGWATTRSLVQTAVNLVGRAHGLPEAERRALVADLREYEREYWRDTGPLARLGLPPDTVLSLRDVRDGLRRRAAQVIRGAWAATRHAF